MWLMDLQGIWVWRPGRGNADRKVMFFLVPALGRSLVLPSRPCSAPTGHALSLSRGRNLLQMREPCLWRQVPHLLLALADLVA